MKKIILILFTLVLICSCSSSYSSDSSVPFKPFQDKYKIDSTHLYYQYFYLDNHEYLYFYESGYYEQVLHSPNCPCNLNK